MGSRYEGYKFKGVREGKGKFYYQDGGFYDGDWRDNKMEGFGILYYQSNRKAYEGLWVNDQFHGQGMLFNDKPIPFDEPFDFNNFDDIDDFWESYEGNALLMQATSTVTKKMARAGYNFQTERYSRECSSGTWWKARAPSAALTAERYGGYGDRTT